MVWQQGVPVGPGHDHPTTLGMLRLVPPTIQLPPAVDIGASVERVLQEILQRRAVGTTPDQLPFARPLAHAHSQPNVVASQVAQQSPERAQLLEQGEEKSHHGLDLLVGVELDRPVGVPDIATRQRKRERAASGLTQAALVEPLLEQMQFRFRHGALQSQE